MIDSQGMGSPRLCVTASDPEALESNLAGRVAAAAARLGFGVEVLDANSRRAGWSPVIDFLVALDAEAVMTARRRIGTSNPRMVTILTVDESPTDTVRRAVRLADAVVVPADRYDEFRRVALRPALLVFPDEDGGWPSIFDHALANRGIHALA